MDLYSVRKQLNMGLSLNNIRLRVTDYARVSTDHLEQKKSLQNQVEHFAELIQNNPNWTYVEGYVDDGISGTSDIKRNNFMKMIDDARNGKFDLIITKEISRFSRNTLDSIKYTRKLLTYGVAVLFVNDNINTALPDSELRLTIMASMAQDEIRRLSERVKFGMNRAIAKGEILGNDMLYGYKKNKVTGNLDIIEDEAKVVRKIFELYAIRKMSLSKIAQTLNDEGYKTSQNKKWCISTISRMIENPKYKGYYCARKSEIVDYMTKKIRYFEAGDWVMYEDKKKIPPIISKELWQEANKRLLSRKKSNKNILQNRYLYSAKIYCGEDNALFYRRVFRKNEKDITWVCSKYLQRGKDCCASPNIRESELNYIFKDLISKLQIDLTKVTQLLMNYYNNFALDKESIKNINKEIANLNAKKDKILELNIEGILTNEEFYERNYLLNDKINKLKKELEQFNNKENNNHKDELENILQAKINSQETFKEIVSLLLNHIVVDKENNDKNKMKLKIFLNYGINVSSEYYEFKRGYDVASTKRYSVFYYVNYG